MFSTFWQRLKHGTVFFVALTQVMKHGAARFRAFGNMADVLMKMGKAEEAISIYQKQLGLSKQSRDKRFEASAYGSLGVCHRMAKQFDKSLGYHTQVREPILNFPAIYQVYFFKK